MCRNAEATALALLQAEEPTLVAFLNLEGQSSTTAGLAVIAAYNSAITALQNWTPGSPAQEVLQVINDLNQSFAALVQTMNLPPEDATLAGLIAAAITSVIAIIEANSTTNPVAQHEITANAVVEVNKLAPGAFKYHKGIFAEFQASPAKQYHNAWNKQCDKLGGKFTKLKQA